MKVLSKLSFLEFKTYFHQLLLSTKLLWQYGYKTIQDHHKSKKKKIPMINLFHIVSF